VDPLRIRNLPRMLLVGAIISLVALLITLLESCGTGHVLAKPLLVSGLFFVLFFSARVLLLEREQAQACTCSCAP
jgi:uncharacterized membrane protein